MGVRATVREITRSRLHENMATVRLHAFVLLVVALGLAACTSSPTVSPTTTTVPKPLLAIDLSATPAGWVPVRSETHRYRSPKTSPSFIPVRTFPVMELQGLVGYWSIRLWVRRSAAVSNVMPPRSTGPRFLPIICCLRAHPIAVHPVERGASSPHPDCCYLRRLLRSGARGTGHRTRSASKAHPRHTYTFTPRCRSGHRFRTGPSLGLGGGVVPGGDVRRAPWWPVTRTSYNYGIGTPCASSPGVSFFNEGIGGGQVVLSEDQVLAAFPCAVWVRTGPFYPGDGIEVDAGARALSQFAQEGLHLAFSNTASPSMA